VRKAHFSLALLVILSASLLWVYWPTVAELFSRWSSDPQYSHGYLVPIFALAILYLRREQRPERGPGLCWWGLVWLLAAGALRALAAYIYFDWLDAFSLLVCLAGLAVLLGGRKGLAWSWPAIAFLVFMIPLPYRLEIALSGPLRRAATAASTYTLQTLGYAALSEGNVILLEDTNLQVAEACSGLSMLMVFFALAVAIIIVIKRSPVEKILLALSAAPIAIIANVMRISLTGVLHETVGHELAERVFHDFAGWLMMPLGLALFAVEIMLLSVLIVKRGPTAASPKPLDVSAVKTGQPCGVVPERPPFAIHKVS